VEAQRVAIESASWNEEMEKRSRRRVPELVTRLAFQGLSENEIGRGRISMMARNANAPLEGRIQKRKTNSLSDHHFQLATHGRSIQKCQLRTHAPQRTALPYSITSSASASNVGGISTPSTLAVLRLMTSYAHRKSDL